MVSLWTIIIQSWTWQCSQNLHITFLSVVRFCKQYFTSIPYNSLFHVYYIGTVWSLKCVKKEPSLNSRRAKKQLLNNCQVAELLYLFWMAAAVFPTAMHIHPLVIPQQTGWEVPHVELACPDFILECFQLGKLQKSPPFWGEWWLMGWEGGLWVAWVHLEAHWKSFEVNMTPNTTKRCDIQL